MKTINCVAIPDNNSSIHIFKIMKHLSEMSKSTKALDFIPHFSIRNDFKIKDENINKLHDELSSVLKDFTNLNVKLNNYGFYPWRIIYLDIKKTTRLQKLHNLVMETIQKYREPWVPDTLLNSEHFKGKQKEYINKYGYQFAFEYYSPHFTICGNDISEETFQKLKDSLINTSITETIPIEKMVFMDKENNNSIISEINLI